jgi:tetrahydromethanopterin S-methyltransferase subunit G
VSKEDDYKNIVKDVETLDDHVGIMVGDLSRDELEAVRELVNRLLDLDDRSLNKVNAEFLKRLY